MAFKGTLARHVFSISRITNTALTNCRVSSPDAAAQVLNSQTNPNKLPPDPGYDGIFKRHLHRQATSSSPELPFLPTGEKLLEKLREMDIARGSIRFDLMTQPPQAAEEDTPSVEKMTVTDAVKILRLSELEKVVKAIRNLIPVLSPYKVEDPRSKEFEEMEEQKASIDKNAERLVQRELRCGLGFLVVQIAALMRLTFWDLTWDVMEPICFYITSMYFVGGYAFFLRTSKEPSFEHFYQSRFSSKQKRLMKVNKFDVDKFNELKKALA